jgi:hypothetical protein
VQKTLPSWTYNVLTFAGVVLIGSMLLNWISLGGPWTASGLRLAWESNHWLFLVPIAGAVLLATAASRSAHTRLAALFAGITVTGYVMFELAQSIIHSGLDTWLILGGAGAMLAGANRERRVWRAIGGIAVLAGFFAPWLDESMWKLMRSGLASEARVLWLIPLAGIAGLASTVLEQGGKLTAIAGLAIYAAFLIVIGKVAYFVFGWGAWAALGASTVALVLAVVVRGGETKTA